MEMIPWPQSGFLRNGAGLFLQSSPRPGFYGDDPLDMVRLPQTGLSSRSLWQVRQLN